MLADIWHRFRLRAKATSELGSLDSIGGVKIVGNAQPGTQLLTAPISGRSCVFYSVAIGEWFNGSKTPLLTESSSAMFRIEDGTGEALVNPARAQSALKASRKRGHSSERLSEHRALLKRHGYTMLDDYRELRSLAYSETIIAPNDRICIMGAVIRLGSNLNDGAPFREQPQQAVLGSNAEFPLFLLEA